MTKLRGGLSCDVGRVKGGLSKNRGRQVTLTQMFVRVVRGRSSRVIVLSRSASTLSISAREVVVGGLLRLGGRGRAVVTVTREFYALRGASRVVRVGGASACGVVSCARLVGEEA